MARSAGFTLIELLLVLALFGVIVAVVSIPLSNLQPSGAVKDAGITVVNTLRRAETQAMTGYYGDSWGVHFSNSDGCVLPAQTIHVFRGSSYTSATTTADDISLPAGAFVSSLSLGGGCDATFARFGGSTTTTGSVTVSNVNSVTRTIQVNQYGFITPP